MIIETRIDNYGENKLQVFKTYVLKVSPATAKALAYPIVFIHGGAWRDPHNTMNDYDKFIQYMDDSFEEGNETVKFYSVDYRLSPAVKHPTHMHDVLSFLNVLHTKGVDQLTLCGHSVGATLITQVLETRLESIHIKRVIFLDGIYNVVSMLTEYPVYADFVYEAFKNEGFHKANWISSGISGKQIDEIYGNIEWITIVHSNDDELLSTNQPVEFANWLIDNGVREQNIHCYFDSYGKHNEVYQNKRVAEIIVKDIYKTANLCTSHNI